MTKAATDFRVRGLVQGVGFRPTVYRIALELGLSGTVWNDAEGVVVHLEGESEVLERFPEALLAGPRSRASTPSSPQRANFRAWRASPFPPRPPAAA